MKKSYLKHSYIGMVTLKIKSLLLGKILYIIIYGKSDQ